MDRTKTQRTTTPGPNRRHRLLASLLISACVAVGAWADAAIDDPKAAALPRAGVADRVLMNGDLYTVDPGEPWVEAMAILDGEIVFLGSDEDATAWIGPETVVTDLGGAMALPGLHDSHVHLLEAFHAGFTCFLPPNAPVESYIPIIQFCAPFQVGSDWVIGFGHSIENMISHILSGGRSPVEILDDAVPNGPAIMMESTSHSVWVNTRGLELAGLDGGAEDPPGGHILRYPDGRPTGLLLDGAGELAMDLAFAPNPVMDALNRSALRRGLGEIAENGITSAADARVYWRRNYVEAYEAVHADGDLTARIHLGLWGYPYLDDTEQLASLAAMYSDDPSSLLQIDQIKVYSDGEVGHSTAALLEPYDRRSIVDPLGLNYFGRDRLTEYITELETVGFDFHIHSIGDRGVAEALDAIQAARETNGELGRRHRLTHLEVVAPDEIARFARARRRAGRSDVVELRPAAEPRLLHPLPGRGPGARAGAAPARSLRIGRPTGAEQRLRRRQPVAVRGDGERAHPRRPESAGRRRGDPRLHDQRGLSDASRTISSVRSRSGSAPTSSSSTATCSRSRSDQIGETEVLMTLLEGEEVYSAPGFPVRGASGSR